MESVARLYTHFAPKNYKLELVLHRSERMFHGTVTITGELAQANSAITLHAKELKIHKATIDSQPATTAKISNNELKIETKHELPSGKHILQLAFSGTITDPMHGIYPCHFTLDGKDQELLATQFESHSAREVFPCIDEPEAKATFDLTLTTETNVTVISNTPVKAQKQHNDKTITQFETTPVMSTYLLAFVVGNLAYKEAKTKNGTVVRTYATPDKVAQTAFALDTTVRALEFYNDYFGISYPLPKCDMVALPDFSSGAMENWGCITFRETALLVDKSSAVDTKQYVATVINHELAHQWFGNLVTMRWWDDLWLNESFANMIEYLATDALFPEWQMWTQFFASETVYAMRRDSLATIQKVRQEVYNPEELHTLFDPAIVYAKGANLLHMLRGYIGDTAFRDGLRIYLPRHKYNNTVADDLWAALAEASHKDIKAFMTPWVSQPGHPVITVGLSEQKVNLHQRRFFSNPREAKKHTTSLWPVPLLSNGAIKRELLDVPTISENLVDTTEPLLLNQGRTGFYLTAYDSNHITKLAKAITKNQLSVLDRLGLLSDSLDLAKAGLQSTVDSLQLLEAYRNEASQPVWMSMVDQIGGLKTLINDDEQLKPHLQRFVANLARNQYDRLGWQLITNEPYFDQLLRPTILGLLCYSEEQSAIKKALSIFEQAQGVDDILGDIRSVVFSVVAKHGGQIAFDKLLTWHNNSTSAEDRQDLAAGLTNAQDLQRISQLIALFKTKDIKSQDLPFWFAYLMRNPKARQTTWQWVQDNWQWIKKTYEGDHWYGVFPRYSAGAFSTHEELESFKAFFEPKRSELVLERAIDQAIEGIEERIMWRDRDLEVVVAYLKAH